jgi:hypothetical protein
MGGWAQARRIKSGYEGLDGCVLLDSRGMRGMRGGIYTSPFRTHPIHKIRIFSRRHVTRWVCAS